EPLGATAPDPHEAGAVRPDPEGPLTVLVQRPDANMGQAAAAEHAAPSDDVEPGVGPDPEIAGAVLQGGEHEVARQAVARREGSSPAAGDAVEAAAVRSDPERAFAILVDRKHEIVGQSLFRRQGRELRISQPVEAASVGADPEASLTILVDRGDDS